jgi:hypothetical protein
LIDVVFVDHLLNQLHHPDNYRYLFDEDYESNVMMLVVFHVDCHYLHHFHYFLHHHPHQMMVVVVFFGLFNLVIRSSTLVFKFGVFSEDDADGGGTGVAGADVVDERNGFDV